METLVEKGDQGAQFDLGLMYEKETVYPGFKTAAKWYTLSAEQGHPIAQYNLGFLYARGGRTQEFQDRCNVLQACRGTGVCRRPDLSRT